MTSPKVAGELVSGRPSWRVASGFPTLGNSARPARVSARRTQSYARPAASVAIISTQRPKHLAEAPILRRRHD
jgi:hypothetical protein